MRNLSEILVADHDLSYNRMKGIAVSMIQNGIRIILIIENRSSCATFFRVVGAVFIIESMTPRKKPRTMPNRTILIVACSPSISISFE